MNLSLSNKLTDFRLLLRDKIYSNDDYINLLMNDLEQIFECTNIAYNKDSMEINIKIKKTAMKKAENYSHSVVYYYPLIIDAFDQFLDNETIQNEINMNDENFKETKNPELYNSIRDNILSLFNATTLLDNIVVIHL